MDTEKSKACYQKALQLLARRDHSCAELKVKLKMRGYSQLEITAVIHECERLNYLNDARFAEVYLKQLQRNGYGINGIKHKLYIKGVPKSVIQQSVEAQDTDAVQLEQCRRELEKKIKTHTAKASIANQGQKLHRFLFGRGFSRHIIRQVIDEAISRDNAATE